ncbi:hypothetical protein LC065_20230 (plasmid) [Halobacillus litoralis]|uniref:hypothetical protein n=1 Tax=Halobacillus litoralis TaxID=45668 RepID=UPI001CFDE515|nr:hypothetical protein [Halobacillus litoralis]WLR49574.1 hypothetical protein LC065_20230 [Halobacillus litoralis]
MFTIREGKSLQQGERVEVYYNLHKGGFSIKSLDKNSPDKGKVVAYSSEVKLEGASFHVNENALSKILAENRKRVYAVVRGYYMGNSVQAELDEHTPVKINPYTCPKFTCKETGNIMDKADSVIFHGRGCGYVIEE